MGIAYHGNAYNQKHTHNTIVFAPHNLPSHWRSQRSHLMIWNRFGEKKSTGILHSCLSPRKSWSSFNLKMSPLNTHSRHLNEWLLEEERRCHHSGPPVRMASSCKQAALCEDHVQCAAICLWYPFGKCTGKHSQWPQACASLIWIPHMDDRRFPSLWRPKTVVGGNGRNGKICGNILIWKKICCNYEVFFGLREIHEKYRTALQNLQNESLDANRAPLAFPTKNIKIKCWKCIRNEKTNFQNVFELFQHEQSHQLWTIT